ncbi:hypothetical protein KFE98_07955 [bacterium SCSIO 12741]|nr:hypothetical protein KFE98_07955 [bacterium SCSIO 12741]
MSTYLNTIAMTWNGIIYGLGDLLLDSFALLRVLGNEFNTVLIVVGFIMATWWTLQLVKFSKQAGSNSSAE